MAKRRRSTKVIAARAIRAVAQLAAGIEALQSAVEAATRDGAGPKRRRLSITPARRRQLKLQGTYMGLVRNLKPKQKAQLRGIREKQGYEAAIRRVRRIVR